MVNPVVFSKAPRLHAVHIQTFEVSNGVALEPMDPLGVQRPKNEEIQD